MDKKITLDAWKLEDINNFYSILKYFEKHEITNVSEAAELTKNYVINTLKDKEQKEQKETKKQKNKNILHSAIDFNQVQKVKMPIIKCPDCKSRISIQPINVSKCTKVDPPTLKSWLSCTKCGYEHYTGIPSNEYEYEWIYIKATSQYDFIEVDKNGNAI